MIEPCTACRAIHTFTDAIQKKSIVKVAVLDMLDVKSKSFHVWRLLTKQKPELDNEPPELLKLKKDLNQVMEEQTKIQKRNRIVKVSLSLVRERVEEYRSVLFA